MRTVFFGTPAWAVPSLEALVRSDIAVDAVVTNPDRPAGRGMELRPSPVKLSAAAAGIEVLQPARARDEVFHRALATLDPDVCTVVAYGKIMPASLLALPRLGFVNLHFSLLPEYRGAAPVQRAIMEGRKATGVSTMVLTEGMDEGPVLSAMRVTIEDQDTAGSLGERLAQIGAPLLVETLGAFATGELAPVGQEHERATYASKVTTDEARIEWLETATMIHNKVRGLNPLPGAWTTLRGKRVKVHEVEPSNVDDAEPGELVWRDGVLVVGTGAGALRVGEMQMQGKKRATGEGAARGLRLAPGERFE